MKISTMERIESTPDLLYLIMKNTGEFCQALENYFKEQKALSTDLSHCYLHHSETCMDQIDIIINFHHFIYKFS
jgi:hypothetical protein